MNTGYLGNQVQVMCEDVLYRGKVVNHDEREQCVTVKPTQVQGEKNWEDVIAQFYIHAATEDVVLL